MTKAIGPSATQPIKVPPRISGPGHAPCAARLLPELRTGPAFAAQTTPCRTQRRRKASLHPRTSIDPLTGSATRRGPRRTGREARAPGAASMTSASAPRTSTPTCAAARLPQPTPPCMTRVRTPRSQGPHLTVRHALHLAPQDPNYDPDEDFSQLVMEASEETAM